MLCSGQARPGEIRAVADGTVGASCRTVDFPAGYEHRLLDFRTSRWPDAEIARFRDLSLKRNVALLLARLAGWRTILLLDDDVQGLGPARAAWAAASLRSATAVGFAMSDFADHSVVCHAFRLGGGEQDVFVTGGACLLDVAAIASFFPAVYNEDWLFLLGAIRLGLVANAGEVGQLTYPPFADPRRACEEEFGDVLAEGLLALVDAGGSPSAADTRYWARFLDDRGAFIDRTTSMIGPARGYDDRARQALRALAAAEQVRSNLRPQDLADYLTDWRADLDVWRRRLAELPQVASLDAALRYLDLRP
jgi:hypothetical protein